MQHAPMRGWDPELAQEPHVYRMLEVGGRCGLALVLGGGVAAAWRHALARQAAGVVGWRTRAMRRLGSWRGACQVGPGEARACPALRTRAGRPACRAHSASPPALRPGPARQAVHHYGEALKAIINEKFGDGIMSGAGMKGNGGRALRVPGAARRCACPGRGGCTPPCHGPSMPLPAPTPAPAAIDFYCTVDKVKGKHGEDRAVITFNGEPRPKDMCGAPGGAACRCCHAARTTSCSLPCCQTTQASSCRMWSSGPRTTRRRGSEAVGGLRAAPASGWWERVPAIPSTERTVRGQQRKPVYTFIQPTVVHHMPIVHMPLDPAAATKGRGSGGNACSALALGARSGGSGGGAQSPGAIELRRHPQLASCCHEVIPLHTSRNGPGTRAGEPFAAGQPEQGALAAGAAGSGGANVRARQRAVR